MTLSTKGITKVLVFSQSYFERKQGGELLMCLEVWSITAVLPLIKRLKRSDLLTAQVHDSQRINQFNGKGGKFNGTTIRATLDSTANPLRFTVYDI